jgi:hypothetical protein
MNPDFDRVFKDMNRVFDNMNKMFNDQTSRFKNRQYYYTTKDAVWTNNFAVPVSTPPYMKKTCSKCGYERHSVQHVKVDSTRDCILTSCQACGNKETSRTKDNPGKFDLPTAEEAMSALDPKTTHEYLQMVKESQVHYEANQKYSDLAKKYTKKSRSFFASKKAKAKYLKIVDKYKALASKSFNDWYDCIKAYEKSIGKK